MPVRWLYLIMVRVFGGLVLLGRSQASKEFLGGRGRGNAPRLPDNTFTDHRDVLAAAIRQVPARSRRKILVRVDGAGASHDLIAHLLSLATPR